MDYQLIFVAWDSLKHQNTIKLKSLEYHRTIMKSLLVLISGLVIPFAIQAQSFSLGSAATYGVLGASTVTSTGNTAIGGDLGVSPGTAITGFPPGTASGTTHSADTNAASAQNDALSAYTMASVMATTTVLTGTDLGGRTLHAGVYTFASSAGMTGILTLDGQGNSKALFVFQMGSTLITATSASVVLINGAKACNVIWQVGSSATLGTGTHFAGIILAYASITGNAGVTVSGSLIALHATVTLINDQITISNDCDVAAATTSPPGPASTSGVGTCTCTCLVFSVPGTCDRTCNVAG
jgi:type VI secretion system secreted protein VgrG